MFEMSIVRRETKEANDIRREDGARPLAKWSWARLARRIDASHENLAALSRGGEGRRRPRRPASGGGKPTPDFLSSVASTAARVSRASFCTLRLDSNPTLPLDSSTRAPRCHGFHSDGVARVILSGEVTRNYEGETLKRLSRGGSRPRRRSNG